MSDLFWEQIPEGYRDQVLDVIEQTPQHQYQVLTKRPDAMLTYSRRRPLPANFWAGVSIENQRNTGRFDVLRAIEGRSASSPRSRCSARSSWRSPACTG
jgi:protein gp37